MQPVVKALQSRPCGYAAVLVLRLAVLCLSAPAAFAAGRIDPMPNEWCAAAALGLTLMAASRDRK